VIDCRLRFPAGSWTYLFSVTTGHFLDPDSNLSTIPVIFFWKYNDKSGKLTFHHHLLRVLGIHGVLPPLPVYATGIHFTRPCFSVWPSFRSEKSQLKAEIMLYQVYADMTSETPVFVPDWRTVLLNAAAPLNHHHVLQCRQ